MRVAYLVNQYPARLDSDMALHDAAITRFRPLQVLRQTVRNPGPLGDRTLLALFQVLARCPEGLG